jgi:hypothetical protein
VNAKEEKRKEQQIENVEYSNASLTQEVVSQHNKASQFTRNLPSSSSPISQLPPNLSHLRPKKQPNNSPNAPKRALVGSVFP